MICKSKQIPFKLNLEALNCFSTLCVITVDLNNDLFTWMKLIFFKRDRTDALCSADSNETTNGIIKDLLKSVLWSSCLISLDNKCSLISQLSEAELLCNITEDIDMLVAFNLSDKQILNFLNYAVLCFCNKKTCRQPIW